jgi:FkbM family methyltransferase
MNPATWHVIPRVRHAGRGLARRFGFDVHEFAPLADPAIRLSRLLTYLEVSTLIDVGANDGSWGLEVRRSGFSGRIVSFEPHPDAFRTLAATAAADPLWDAFPYAVAPVEGTLDIRLTADSRWSSAMRAASGASDAGATMRVHRAVARRLDDALESSVRRSRLFLKIDVQGYELEALHSADGIIDSVVGAQTEVMIDSFYEGQPSFVGVVTEFARRGLRLAGVANGHIRGTGVETYVDLLFVRSSLDALRGEPGGSSSQKEWE